MENRALNAPAAPRLRAAAAVGMNDADIERAHIKGQLQGLRAALRQQPANGVSLPSLAGAAGPAFSPRAAPRAAPPTPPQQPTQPRTQTPAVQIDKGPSEAEERARQLELQLKQAQLELQLKDAQAAAREEALRREKVEAELARLNQQPPPSRPQQQQQPPPPPSQPQQHTFQPPQHQQPPSRARRESQTPSQQPPSRVGIGGPRASSPRLGRPEPKGAVGGASLGRRRPRGVAQPTRHDATARYGRGRRPAAAAAAIRNGASPAAGAKKKSNKSECVQRVEEMQRMREERRRRAEEKKNKRAQEALDAQDHGGIEAVDFLNQIKEYQNRHNIPEVGIPWTGGDVWQDDSGSSIRVCVRKRPMLPVETLKHDFDVVRGEATATELVVLEPKTKVDLTKQIEAHRFTFDACFNENDGNEAIYSATLHPLLAHVFAGGHATVFAFGQTGSGKTCTMAGHGNHAATDGNASGLYKLAAHDTVGYAARDGSVDIGVSFFEVYRGQVLDLLGNRNRLEVLEDGKGRVQMQWTARGANLSRGRAARSCGRRRSCAPWAPLPPTSSRAAPMRSFRWCCASARQDGRWASCRCVDLAGSERAADANDKDRQTRIEGAEINKSLLCLKECIRSLDSNNGHVPFRGSKLTQVLRDSFAGRAKTVMIATVSPGSSAAENTLNTLRYAQRVKEFSAKRPPAAGGANRRASGALPPPGRAGAGGLRGGAAAAAAAAAVCALASTGRVRRISRCPARRCLERPGTARRRRFAQRADAAKHGLSSGSGGERQRPSRRDEALFRRRLWARWRPGRRCRCGERQRPRCGRWRGHGSSEWCAAARSGLRAGRHCVPRRCLR